MLIRILLLALSLLLAVGCAHRPPGQIDTTAAMVMKVSHTARAFACDDGPPLGRVPALNIDTPPQDFAGVVGQIRAWLCADPFAALLDLATELVTRPSPSAESDAGPPTATAPPPVPAASPPSSDDAGLSPTTADAGEVTP